MIFHDAVGRIEGEAAGRFFAKLLVAGCLSMERNISIKPDSLDAELSGSLRRGSLKIFFGSAPGVGKTYSMLQEARALLKTGADVVCGIVETHGRSETDALLEGIETISRKHIDYRGRTIEEFDLDAALSRKPEILLVDELAHTNAPGSRHKKRWQDVNELLSTGIDVFTTLNVQHIESLNDVVAQITGIPVRETVPDMVLQRADSLKLVDLSADELIQRMKEGKVYLPAQTRQALRFFFRKGNLTALRELTLRQVAEQVDSEMKRYRLDKGVKGIWPARERILVLVGPNPMGIRLIRSARRMAGALHAEWIVLHVESPGEHPLSQAKERILSDHMKLAETLGAQTAVLSGVSVPDTILDFARERNISKIIVGKPTHPPWRDKIFGSLLEDVVRGSGDIDVYVITGDPTTGSSDRSTPGERKRGRIRDWIYSLGMVAAITGSSLSLRPVLSIVDIVMLFLLGIVLVARYSREAPSLVAIGLSVASMDYFFIPPINSFAVSDIRYLGTFAVMFIVGFVINRLTFRLRHQEEETRRREERTRVLYTLSRELSRLRSRKEVCQAALRHIDDHFEGETKILFFGTEAKTEIVSSSGSEPLTESEAAVAQWVFSHQEKAGTGTDTLPDAEALYVPLNGPTRRIGVLRLRRDKVLPPLDGRSFPFLENIGNLTGIGLERSLLEEEHVSALVENEKERIRNTLLSSVSHDLRTPLGVITGAASTLVSQSSSLSPDHRTELEWTIVKESRRLTRLIENVLGLTRLEAGVIVLNKNLISLEEIIGSALSRIGTQGSTHPVSVDLPPLPLVEADELLVSQVVSNLLENAIQHTPTGTPVSIRAWSEEGRKNPQIHVVVEDRGPGVPEEKERTIFAKLPEERERPSSGLGLGLPLAKTILSLHGGSIWLENNPGSGVAFHFTLPSENSRQTDLRQEVDP